MLSIILVNFHSSQLLQDCLASILKDDGAKAFEIIIVDNSPQDGAKEQLLLRYPSISWMTMSDNAGFARANNAGIKASKGDTVLLLNPDTLVQNGAVIKCYEALMNSYYAAAGVQLLNADGSPQISGNFFMTGGLNYLMQVPYLGRLIRGMGLMLRVQKTNLPEAKQEITHVHWINGAFLMVKKSAIGCAGLLDEDFFLYNEEIEWCHRLRKCGELCILGNLHVIHLEGQSSKNAFQSETTGYKDLSDRKGYQLLLSMFVWLRKQFGIGWFFFHLIFHTVCITVVLICALADGIFHLKNFTRIMHQAIGYALNVLRCWNYCFRIVSGRPYFYKVL